MAVQILIIEDQRMFRDLLASLLGAETQWSVAARVSTMTAGWEACVKHTPDLVVLDLHLPDGSGLDLGKKILARLPDTHLLAITSLTDPITTTQVYESGFHGYVEKDQSPEIVMEALQTVSDGGFYFTQLVRENRRRIYNDPDALQKILSPQEQKIIGHVAAGASNKMIAEILGISLRTVENHRYRITKRLDLPHAQALADFGRKFGLHRLAETSE